MAKARITKMKGQTAIVLPDELAQRFRVFQGETVYVRESARGLEVTGLSPSDEAGIRDGQEAVRQYKERWRYAGG